MDINVEKTNEIINTLRGCIDPWKVFYDYVKTGSVTPDEFKIIASAIIDKPVSDKNPKHIEIDQLLESIKGYGTDAQPLTVGILKAILNDMKNKK